VAPRVGDVADWTASRRAGQATLEDAVPVALAGGRRVSVNACAQPQVPAHERRPEHPV
jgi:hypothetical protein